MSNLLLLMQTLLCLWQVGRDSKVSTVRCAIKCQGAHLPKDDITPQDVLYARCHWFALMQQAGIPMPVQQRQSWLWCHTGNHLALLPCI